VAIEAAALPLALARGLGRRSCPDVTSRLVALRALKDPHEVELIQGAASLASAGQRAAREAAGPGVPELDLWLAAQAEMQRARGAPVHAGVDLIAGNRTELVDGAPGRTTPSSGDPILFDLAPRLKGYWADSCATFCWGQPSATLRSRHAVVRRALDRGLQAVRDGALAGNVDRAMRDVLDSAGLRCLHHTGHGVGTAAQEPPWILPHDTTVLLEGMVIALEPGAYADGIGVRLEHVVAVEVDGPRLLTAHSVELG
jgi:Xaa-Pro aminopeptidase